MPAECHSLADLIVRNARDDPTRNAVIFYAEDETQHTITNDRLLDRVQCYASALRALGAHKGDIVVLALQHRIELIYAFWATIYLGSIPAIFPYPPLRLRPQSYLERVRHFAAHCRARFVIAADQYQSGLNLLLAGHSRSISIAQLTCLASSSFPPEEIAGDGIAILQHSSGTTGAQKAIAHTHRMCLASLESIRQTVPPVSDDVIVGWLPLFHDGGLVTELLIPAYEGVPVAMISPSHWVFKPSILFRALHDHRGTWCWMPNFALNRCVGRISDAELDGIDLSSVRVLYTTAEPTRADSLKSFAEKFGPFGFSESAFTNVYGMAEVLGRCTITPVVGPPGIDWIDRSELQLNRRAAPVQERSSNAMSIVSCGAPRPGVRMQVVDDHEQLLPDRVVGHIRVRSDWMPKDYFRSPEETRKLIRDGWLETGDMGYMAEGELYVCGRQKDLIISYGKKIYPEDLEEIANRVEGLAPGRSVAFGVMDDQEGTEGIVMVCELRPRVDPASAASTERMLRCCVLQVLGVCLADVRLVSERDWVIKTTSGKIARSANRDKYLRMFDQRHTCGHDSRSGLSVEPPSGRRG